MLVKWKILLPDGLSGGLYARGSNITTPGVVCSNAPSAPVDPRVGDCARATDAKTKTDAINRAFMAYCVQVAFTKPREPPVGKVTEALQVDCWRVPWRGEQLTVW